MGVRVHWLPTGAETAEDARNGTLALMTQAGLNTARVGVIPGTGGAQPFALTSTGSLSCSVGPGQAIVSPAATSTQGAYPVTVDATGSGLPTVSFAAGGSLARTDVIYLQVQDNAEDASGVTAGKVAVVQGANGGGVPSVPGGALALWQVPVPASASSINFATATFVATGTVALGGVVPAANSTSPGSPYKGQVRSRLDLPFTTPPGALEIYDGAAWQPAIPASMPRGRVADTNTTAAGSNSSNSTPFVHLNFTVTMSTSRRYRLTYRGMANGSVANLGLTASLYYIAGSSMPAGASGATLVPNGIQTVAVNGSTIFDISQEFVGPGNGTFTFAGTYNLGSGTGTVAAVSGSLHQLFLDDIGV
jgi:hypothetical protein